jgi:DDE superfamily endonuclease
MNLEGTEDGASRFAAYVGELTSVIGHADRARPLNDYCAGLLVSEGRRSVEPIAAVTAPHEASVQHQRLLHFVANAPWSDEPVLAKVRELVIPAIHRHGPIEAWIIDDTSFPKCGSKSVGVHHQYCGQLGKQANCQVAVTLSIAKTMEPTSASASRTRKRRSVSSTSDRKSSTQISFGRCAWCARRISRFARKDASCSTANPRPISLPPTGVHWNTMACACSMIVKMKAPRPTCK